MELVTARKIGGAGIEAAVESMVTGGGDTRWNDIKTSRQPQLPGSSEIARLVLLVDVLLLYRAGPILEGLFSWGYLFCLYVDSDRAEHVYHAEPVLPCQTIVAIDEPGRKKTHAIANEAGTPRTGRVAIDRSGILVSDAL